MFWRGARLGLARSAMSEAASQIERALRLLKELPMGPARQKCQLDLLVVLGGALTAINGYAAEETGKAYIRADLGDTDNLIRVRIRRILYYLMRAEVRQSHAVATEILSLGEKHGSDKILMLGHRLLGVSRFELGDVVGGRTHLETAAALLSSIQKIKAGSGGRDASSISLGRERPRSCICSGKRPIITRQPIRKEPRRGGPTEAQVGHSKMGVPGSTQYAPKPKV